MNYGPIQDHAAGYWAKCSWYDQSVSPKFAYEYLLLITFILHIQLHLYKSRVKSSIDLDIASKVLDNIIIFDNLQFGKPLKTSLDLIILYLLYKMFQHNIDVAFGKVKQSRLTLYGKCQNGWCIRILELVKSIHQCVICTDSKYVVDLFLVLTEI